MQVYCKIDQNKLEHIFIQQLLPNFTQDLPKKVIEYSKAISMDICMSVLMVASVTKTSIQKAVKLLSKDLQESDQSNSDQVLTRFAKTYNSAIPHPNKIRRTLKLWTPHQINARYRKYNWELVSKLKKSGFFQSIHGKQQKIAVAFDTTEMGYYGLEDAFTVYTKGRSPAKLCHSYLTLQIVCGGIRLILDVEPIYRDSKSLEKLMKKMLRRVKRHTGLKISTIYLDRGFYQTDILRYLKHNFTGRILMPVIRTSRVKNAIRKWHDQHGYTAGEMELEIGSKKKSQKYILIFSPLNEKDRAKWRQKKKADPDAIHNDFLYFCLLKPPELLQDGIQYSYEEFFKILSQDYRNRWGIETGNRDFKTVLAKTTSRSYSLRYWLMWNAVLIYNQWVMENLGMMEKKGTPDNYTCCKRPTLQEIDEEQKLKQSKKYPSWSRVTSQMPNRKWHPKPLETLNSLCGLLQTIAARQLDRYIKTGCDPPAMKKRKSTSS